MDFKQVAEKWGKLNKLGFPVINIKFADRQVFEALNTNEINYVRRIGLLQH